MQSFINVSTLITSVFILDYELANKYLQLEIERKNRLLAFQLLQKERNCNEQSCEQSISEENETSPLNLENEDANCIIFKGFLYL